MILKLIRTLHAWAGMTLALLLLLSSVTGTLLIWKEDYVKLVTPAAQVDFTPSPAALARIAEAVEAGFENNDILNIQFATAEFPLTKVTLYDTNYAYLDIQGNVVDEWHMNERFEEWLYDLHHRLLLDDLGLTITGLAAMALIILVLLGVISFVPLRRQFARGIVPKSVKRSELVTSHRNLGILIAWPLLLTLITGVILAFPYEAEELLLDEHRRSEEYSDNMVVGLMILPERGLATGCLPWSAPLPCFLMPSFAAPVCPRDFPFTASLLCNSRGSGIVMAPA